jgi:hypothetical protein
MQFACPPGVHDFDGSVKCPQASLMLGCCCKLLEQLGTTVRHCRAVVLNCSGTPAAFCYESRLAGDADLCGSKVVRAACSAFFSDEIAVSHRNFCARNFG